MPKAHRRISIPQKPWNENHLAGAGGERHPSLLAQISFEEICNCSPDGKFDVALDQVPGILFLGDRGGQRTSRSGGSDSLPGCDVEQCTIASHSGARTQARRLICPRN